MPVYKQTIRHTVHIIECAAKSQYPYDKVQSNSDLDSSYLVRYVT